MNARVRRFIGYWSMLLLGLFLLFVQGKKYYRGDFLKYTFDQLTVEAVILGIAIIMIVKPFALIKLVEKLFRIKYADQNSKTDGEQ